MAATSGAALACAALAPAPSFALSLTEAVQQALRTNPIVQSAVDDRRIADHQLTIAEAGFLPRIDLIYDINREQLDEPLTRLSHTQNDDFEHREATATLSHTLFDGRNTGSQVDRARHRVRSSAFTLAATSEEIALNAIGAYLEVLRRQGTVQLAQDNLAAHRRIREMIRHRTAGGVSRRPDFDQAESRLALAVSSLRQEQAALEDAKAAFLKFVGVPATDLALPKGALRPLPGFWADPDPEVDPTTPPEDATPAAWPSPSPQGAPGLKLATSLGSATSPSGETRDERLPAPVSRVVDAPCADCPENEGQSDEAREAAAAVRDWASGIALEGHPAVKAARENVAAAKAGVGVARAAYAPRITFEVSGSTSEDRVRDEVNDVAAGFRARWNLYNGGADHAGRHAAQAQLDKAQEDQRRIEQQVTESIAQAGNALLSARDRVRVLQRYARSITSAQAAYVRQFGIGQRSLLDLVNAQDEVFSARAQLVTAEFTEVFSEYRVYQAMGQLLPAMNVAPPRATAVEP